jgi:hypothetical protein
MAGKDLHDDVRQLADPQGRGRQFLAAFLDRQTNARAAGFVLTRQSPAGRWNAATYALQDVGGGAPAAPPPAWEGVV